MPTALNSGRQALPPSVPTLPIPNPPVREGLAPSLSPPSGAEGLPHFYGLDYFHDRLEALGLNKDNAIDYGLDVDEQGNILQLVRSFDGSFIEFIPRQFRKKVDRLLSHRSSYQPHLEMYSRVLAVTRYHPDYLKENPSKSKYGNQYGEKVRPLPAPRAITAYNDGTTGGLITFIEGYFKAIALDLAGIESVAFTGITVYRITPDLREYLLRRRPDRIMVMYDADALDISSSTTPSSSDSVREGLAPSLLPPASGSGGISSRRNEDFYNSAQSFTTALFSLFSSIDHTCEIVFVMGKPSSPSGDRGAKGLDDLIEVHGTDAVTEDLRNFKFISRFRKSDFFAGFTLAKSTCRRKLGKLFLGDNYRDWYERPPIQPPAKNQSAAVREGLAPSLPSPPLGVGGLSGAGGPFTYRSAQYEPIANGDLYDETTTYQLNTNPFQVETPTDHLTIKHYLTDQGKQLRQLIENHDRLAIQAPTGSGKTTFLTKLARKEKIRMVIAMPTINLAEQTARSSRGYALTGDRDIAKIRAANEHDLIVCTYDTLHQVPDLWRRILVFDEAHNLINQYGQVYNGYQPFRAETLRNCVRLFSEAAKVILLSGTMPPLLCHAFNFHLVTFRRLENPNVRVFDIEANGSDAAALSKCLITRLAEVNWATPKLQVAFWNHTDQINNLKDTLVELSYLKEEEIAIISRTHYNAGNSPDLDDIIRKQQINPRIKLLLCTCLISEGVNINNTNVGRIYTVGLRCEDTFRQFIARFRKLKTVNVFSILEAERDLHPDFFRSAKLELLENIERADLQANHLQRREEAAQSDYDDSEIPFLDQIENSKEYQYRNKLLNLVYEDGEWYPDPLHVLAAIHGRKLATGNNCFFYTRLHATGFNVLRIKQIPTDELVEETIDHQQETAKALRTEFREQLLEDVLSYPDESINALYLLYQEKDNRHGLQSLRTLVPDLLDDHDGATGARYLGQHRRHLDDYAIRRILRFARLHAMGVDIADKARFLALSDADFNHEYKAATFHFEQLVADDPELRKQMLTAHKEEVRIKQKVVSLFSPSLEIGEQLGAGAGAEQGTKKQDSPPRSPACPVSPPSVREGLAPSLQPSPLSGKDLLQKLQPLLSVPRPGNLPPIPTPRYQRPDLLSGTQSTFDILGLTPAKAVNLLRRILHATINGHGRYRTITIGAPFSEASPPPLAAVATRLLKDPVKILQLIDA